MGVRIPDGLLLLYCPTMINFVVSPARMLCLMDPLLPFSFMMGCLRAYTCPQEDMEKKQRKVAQLLNMKSKSHHPFTSSTAGTAINSKNRRPTVDEGRIGFSASNSVEVAQECTETEPTSPDSVELEQPHNENERSSDWSDTMASATSLNSNTRSNTEVPTPNDESSGLSFEEDSQPIKNVFPGMLISNAVDDATTQFYTSACAGGQGGELAVDGELNLSDELPADDPTAQYVSEFLDR